MKTAIEIRPNDTIHLPYFFKFPNSHLLFTDDPIYLLYLHLHPADLTFFPQIPYVPQDASASYIIHIKK